MATIKRNASAQWSGTGKEGKGAITTQSGVLSARRIRFRAGSATRRAPIPRS